MTKVEAIEKYYDKIRETMVSKYRDVLDYDGRVQYQIYVWEDGEIEVLETPQGDSNSWLRANDGESRELYYITTVSYGCGSGIPYQFECDEDDREAAIQEEMVAYEQGLDDLLDDITKEAQRQEERDDEYHAWQEGRI